jgi:hypothetical protein
MLSINVSEGSVWYEWVCRIKARFSHQVFFSHIPIITDIRRVTLLRRKAPGPYEDIAGPTILSISLMAAIVAQFGMKLYAMM